jgi:FixJ family two-component response regulator
MPNHSAFRSTNNKDHMQESRRYKAVIAIVDDDASVRQGLERLIRSSGFQAETFASAQEFLARVGVEAPSCVVLDLQMPGLTGLELQKQMAEVGLETPIVFLTGHGNIPTTVQAMKAGAIEFLTKPVEEQDLLRAIREAIERDRRTRQKHADMRDLRDRYESLTAREQEVMRQVVSGLLNKQIAAELKITEDTVKFHRGNIMRKMRADSLADLVRMSESLGIHSNRRSDRT